MHLSEHLTHLNTHGPATPTTPLGVNLASPLTAGETEAGWRGCWCEILKGPPTHYRTVAAILSEGPWGSCYFLGESVTLSMC